MSAETRTRDFPSGRVEHVQTSDRFDTKYQIVGPRAALDEFFAWIEEYRPRQGYCTMLYGLSPVGDGEGPWRATVTHSNSAD